MLGDVRRAGLLRYHPVNGSRVGGVVSRIRVAVLASTSTLASVAVTEVHGSAVAIVAGCAALAAGAAAWSSSENREKIGIILTSYPKKALDFYIGQKTVLRLP